ncbi:thermonuclease family protein [Candidatus Woesearchaeota archaeon]|nr:thermonuclease family protein [Candidatus Woesearchaeota archaeon]MBW3005847.1 thermonuclease family protein [Candidatus Woesearchaeota archaeon]
MRRKIKKWLDGDSGHFSDGTSFRLARVRAPEKHQFGGSRATRAATGMTGRSKGNVFVKTIATGKYGRKIVEMSNKDGSINNRLLKRGFRNKGR